MRDATERLCLLYKVWCIHAMIGYARLSVELGGIICEKLSTDTAHLGFNRDVSSE